MLLKSDNLSSRSRQTIHFFDNSEMDIHYIQHHISHASCFFCSPFEEAAILVTDAFGEKHSVTFCEGKGNRLETIWSQEFPHSLGSFYSVLTEYLGFVPSSEEWKLMGASSYGNAEKYYDRLRTTVQLKDDGGFELDLTHFNHYQFYRPGMFTSKLPKLLEIVPRREGEPLTQDHFDLAAAAQKVFEDTYFHLLSHLHQKTGMDKVIISGGAALNCVANGRLLREGPFERLWIQPAAGDAGGALGCALATWHEYLDQPRYCNERDAMQGAYLGPAFTDAEAQQSLEGVGAVYTTLQASELYASVAELLAKGHVVGWFQGRMEFGPRALGARSILGDPRNIEMQSVMNLKIKYRESFRPFAPAVLAERIADYFEQAEDSPYMLLVANVREMLRKQVSVEDDQLFGIDKLNVLRSELPAITHIDYSARIQSVHKETNPQFHALLSAFDQLTGCGVLVNTSFNVRGEPIVCTPLDAYRCFMRTEMDSLVIVNMVFSKMDQPVWNEEEDWRETFELD